jgi:hypothetical protein
MISGATVNSVVLAPSAATCRTAGSDPGAVARTAQAVLLHEQARRQRQP